MQQDQDRIPVHQPELSVADSQTGQ